MTTRLLSGFAVGFVLVVATACGGTESPQSQAPAPPGASNAVRTTAVSTSAAGMTCTKNGEAGDTTISIKNHAFPESTTISAGQTVTWSNDDTLNHTVTFRNGGPDCGLMLIHDTASITFPDPGTYDYFCRFHQVIMQGKIVVQ